MPVSPALSCDIRGRSVPRGRAWGNGMDGDMIWPVVAMLAFVAVFAAIILIASKAEKRRFEALEAMASERGWTVRRESFGKQRGYVVAPADGSDWMLELRKQRSSGSSRRGSVSTSIPGRSEFRSPQPAMMGGLAMFTAGASAGGLALAESASSLLGMFDNKIGRAVMSRLLGPEMGEHVGALQPFPSPPDSHMTVMATADPALWFDVPAIGRALEGWPKRNGLADPPQLAIGSSGLRLFIPREVTDPVAVAQLVELGLELRASAARAV